MKNIYVEKNIPILNEIIINGLKISIRHWQNYNKPKILLLHGWMDCSACFQFLVDEFGTLKSDIYAPDWRGMGLSQKQEFGYYDRFVMLDDLNKLIEVLNFDEPINIIGHSLGGMIASLYAAIMPKRVKTLTLIEAFGVKNYNLDNSTIKVKKFLNNLKNYPKFSNLSSEEDFIKKIVKRNPNLTFERAKYISQQLLMRDISGKLTYKGDVKHKIEQPYPYNFDWNKSFFNDIVCPVLWIEGELVEYNRYLNSIKNELDFRCKQLKNVYKKKIQNTGHMIHWENPNTLAQVITEFLNNFE